MAVKSPPLSPPLGVNVDVGEMSLNYLWGKVNHIGHGELEFRTDTPHKNAGMHAAEQSCVHVCA